MVGQGKCPRFNWTDASKLDLLLAIYKHANPTPAQWERIIEETSEKGYPFNANAAQQHLMKLRRKDTSTLEKVMARVGASRAQYEREMQEAAFDQSVPGRRGAAMAAAARAAPAAVPAAGNLGPVPGVPPAGGPVASLGPVPGVPPTGVTAADVPAAGGPPAPRRRRAAPAVLGPRGGRVTKRTTRTTRSSQGTASQNTRSRATARVYDDEDDSPSDAGADRARRVTKKRAAPTAAAKPKTEPKTETEDVKAKTETKDVKAKVKPDDSKTDANREEEQEP
ncbi:hypothetical protein PG996_004223 [Apiospora saccharicola]|uniref:Uncharacterized protein n=1 Tax=Apiospora saccharicola TaxID=335842 RepID=A0ABR1W3L9_9PEZI